MPHSKRKLKSMGGAFHRWNCPACGFSCPSHTGLRLHEQKNHPNAIFVEVDDRRKNACIICKRGFRDVEDLKKHYKFNPSHAGK